VDRWPDLELAPFVVCPQTLGPLEQAEGGYWSPRAQRLYPVRRGLVFMGYPARDAAPIRAAMDEEHAWQGTGEAAAKNLAFLRESAPRAVDFINVIQRYVERGPGRPRALDLGCGNGWVSWLLAAAGFDTWMCDFEANSLATGLNLEHPNLGDGKRFVTDARFAPVASGSMDVVVFKEFVHHVKDYRPLFREANRVLRDGGVLALIEPVRSAWKTLHEIRHPDSHKGHEITWPDAYLRAIGQAGFQICREAYVYESRANRRRVMASLKRRAAAAIDETHPSGDWFSSLHLRLIGGAQLLVVARKSRQATVSERPPMVAIDPDTLVLREEELAGYAEFPGVLQDAARMLRQA
jgi:SAM-dependent methyltransferase